jgi:serine/threonine protein kinase
MNPPAVPTSHEPGEPKGENQRGTGTLKTGSTRPVGPDTAKAYDAAGNVGTSTASTVTVSKADTTPPTVSVTAPAVPDYELLRRIGGGAYGEVWLARSKATGALRAAKIVWRRTFADERPFQREFEGIQRFERISREHPSQLALFHIGRNEAEGYFYYIMELADGLENPKSESPEAEMPTPNTALRSAASGLASAFDLRASDLYTPHTLRADLTHGRLPAARVLEIGLALTEALAHLHNHGLVHRDVKPSNVIFVTGRPKLADIGLVTDASDTCSIVGTEGYLPPEGPGTPQADLFALGKVLYEAATGTDRRQFPRLPEELRAWPDANQVFELNEVVLRACAPDAQQRYRSAGEMFEDLAKLQQGRSIKQQRIWQHRLAAARRIGIAAAAVALAAAGGVFLWQTTGPHGRAAGPTVNEDGTAGTRDPRANEAYQLGLLGLRQGTAKGFSQAQNYFSVAIKAEPRFVLAHARLFEVYLMSEDHGIPFIEGKSNALKELSVTLTNLAPTNAETHAAMAIVLFLNEWRWVEAKREFEHALELDPDCRMALTYYGYFLTRQGQYKKARDVLEHALARYPTSALIAKFRGHCEYVARDYDAALRFYDKASDLEPSYPSGHYWAGRVYLAQTNYSQALVEMEEHESRQGLSNVDVEYEYEQYRKALGVGPQGYWTNLIHEIEKRGGTRMGTPLLSYTVAMAYARLGDKQHALTKLEDAFAEHDSMEDLLVDEVWDGYRQEPRFNDILKKVGLYPWRAAR